MASVSNCCILGSGLSALAAARTLVAAGYTVEVVEARERAGGRGSSAALSPDEQIN